MRPRFFHPSRFQSLQCAILCLCLIAQNACMTTRDSLTDVNADMRQMHEQIEKLQKDQVESRSRKKEMLSELRTLVLAETPVISGRESITEQKIVAIPLDPTQTVSVTQHSIPTTAPVTEADILFRNGLVLYNAGNYAMAAESYALALQNAKDADMKAKCLFWLGESNYRLREWIKAVQCFTEIEKELPTHPIIPSALLKKGFAFLFSGNQASGIQTLQRLVQSYPNSDEAAVASEQLQRLQSY